MRTILQLAGVSVALIGAGAASAAPQPPGNSAVPQLRNAAPLPGPAGGCLPGYAQDPKAVTEAWNNTPGDVAAKERAVAMVPCVRVDAASAAGVKPPPSRTVRKPPS
jgi:hypothetical protein